MTKDLEKAAAAYVSSSREERRAILRAFANDTMSEELFSSAAEKLYDNLGKTSFEEAVETTLALRGCFRRPSSAARSADEFFGLEKRASGPKDQDARTYDE